MLTLRRHAGAGAAEEPPTTPVGARRVRVRAVLRGGNATVHIVLWTRVTMPNPNLDELRFFLNGRDDVAEQVARIGATTTEVMQAVGIREAHDEPVPRTTAEYRVAHVCEILRAVEAAEAAADMSTQLDE